MKRAITIALPVALAAMLLTLVGCSSSQISGPSSENSEVASGKLRLVESQPERATVYGIIATVDHQERLVTMEKSNHLIVVAENAKFLGVVSESPRDFRFEDLRKGIVARFVGDVKDGRILVADYVEVEGNFTKPGVPGTSF